MTAETLPSGAELIRHYGWYARDMYDLGVRNRVWALGDSDGTVRWDDANDRAVFRVGERTLHVPGSALDADATALVIAPGTKPGWTEDLS